MKFDKLLDSVYYNVKSPACYAGVQPVYREAKRRNSSITQKDVKRYLLQQKTYTLHKPVIRNFRRNKIRAIGVDTNWEADLCDMQQLAKNNENYRYLLTCIDVFSKFAWVEPLRSKKASEVAQAFLRILKKGRKCWYLMTDGGTEFKSDFKKLLDKKGIVHVVTRSPDIKCAHVERYNRTLKTRIWKYFTKHNTKRYLNVLQSIVAAINNSYTDTIGCKPVEVSMANENIIRKRLYGPTNLKPAKFGFETGQRVRIAREKKAFKKGYTPNFTEEIFIISKRIPRKPTPVYRIRDLKGEEIEGIFYPAELVHAV